MDEIYNSTKDKYLMKDLVSMGYIYDYVRDADLHDYSLCTPIPTKKNS